MKSVVRVIKIFQAAAKTGWRGQAVASLLSGLLNTVQPRRKRIDSNLSLVYPGQDAAWRSKFRRSVYDGLAWTITEVLALQRDPRQALDWVSDSDIEGRDVLDRLMDDKGGALMLTGHFGNWELLGSWYAQLFQKRGRRLYAIYQEIHDHDISALLKSFRERCGISVLPKGASTLELARMLREGAHIAILADVSWLGGVTLPFMGHPCTNSPGPAVLAMLGGVPVVPIVSYRQAPFRHSVRLMQPLHMPKDGPRDVRLEQMTLSINHALEELIARRPELWFWLHDRWKK